MNVTLRLARSFVAVAATGSFTRAAQSLHVTQPALTVHIKQLETRLGVRLVERDTRSVALTAAGRELAPRFRDALENWDALVANARLLGGGKAEPLSIACLPSLSGTVLPQLVSDFNRRNPAVEVIARDVDGATVLQMVRSGEVDLGIGAVGRRPVDLDVTDLAEEPMYAVYPPGHPLGALPEVGIRDVVKHPLVLVGKHSSLRQAVEEALGASGDFVSPVKEVSYSASAVALVRAGVGVTVLPSTARELLADRSLRWRPIRDCFRKLAVLTRRSETRSEATRAFIQVTVDRFSSDIPPFGMEPDIPG